MKNIKDQYYPLLLVLLLIVIVSCSKEDYSSNYSNIKWIGIEINNMDNSGEHAKIIKASHPISALAYAIALDIQDSLDLYQSGGSSAGGYNKGIENPIKSITITSLQRFNELHPIGASLNEYFKIRPGVRDSTMKQLSNAKPIKISSLHSKNDLLLYQSPEKAFEYQFIVKIELANNQIFSDTTAPIYLEK